MFFIAGLRFGIRGITKIYDRNIFEFTDNTLYVQLPFDKDVKESKGKVREKSKGKVRGKSKEKILELIITNQKITIPEIADRLGLSISGVEKNIRKLKHEGILSRTTNTKNGDWIIIE